jgi:hypothetical protein
MTIKTEVKKLPASWLTVDPEVQRLPQPSRVKSIADEWDDLMVGVLTVSHRVSAPLDQFSDVSNTYVVLDGQTRLEAFRLVAGVPATNGELLCEVYEGLTRSEEAEIFLKHNNRRAVHARDTFRIAYVAGQEWAVEISEVLSANGWAARGVDVGRPLRQFGAVSAARKVYETGGRDALVKTFTTITNAWGSKNRDAVNAHTLYGLGMLHARHPELTSRQLHGFVTKLGKITPLSLVAEVTADKRRYRQSVQTASYNWVLALYNRGRATENQIA